MDYQYFNMIIRTMYDELCDKFIEHFSKIKQIYSNKKLKTRKL